MLFVVLPAYNEEKGLKLLLDEIQGACKGIPAQTILVNDASTDQTLQIAREYANNCPNVHVVTHPVNKGLGGSLMTGFKHAFALRRSIPGEEGEWGKGREDVILTMDADNTHPAERIPLMVEQIRQGADLVVASRYAGGKQYGLNPLRQVLSWGAGKVMGIFFPVAGLKDYSCGYRAYRASVLEAAYLIYGDKLIESRSFAGMVELLLKVVSYSREVREVPFDLHYEKKQGKSKMRIMATIMGYFTLIIRMKKETWGLVEWVGE